MHLKLEVAFKSLR